MQSLAAQLSVYEIRERSDFLKAEIGRGGRGKEETPWQTTEASVVLRRFPT